MEVNSMKRTFPGQLSLQILKRARLSDTDSETESVHSIQQQDTDLARDTSDTYESDMTEYEVAHLSPDRPNPFFSTDDSDEENEINEIAELGAVVAAVTANFDVETSALADTSTEPSSSPTSNSDVDPELPRLDYLDFWTCAQCKATNENRHVPFCNSCYNIRKNFHPPRPKGKKPKRNWGGSRDRIGLLGSQSGPSTQASTSTDSGISSQEIDVVDGPIGVDAVDGPVGNDIVDGASGSQEGPSCSKPQTSQAAPSTQDESNANVCEICLNRPADGLFSHGNSVHRFGCYICAKKTWKKDGKCPLCRRKILRVFKLLNS